MSSTITKSVAQRGTFAARLRFAISKSPWSITSAAQFLRLPIALLRDWREGHQRPMFAGQLIGLANLLQVDPRWLATGHAAPSAQRALAEFDRARQRGSQLNDRRAEKARRLIVLLPEDPGPRGCCRYCGCLEGDWADESATICLPCVTRGEA